MSLSRWKRLEIRLITFRVAYTNSKQTWSLADGCCQFEAKFRTLMIEETLSATNFRFVAKIHRKRVLCSDEMSLNRPWIFDRIFVRTFDERSLEQITKFAEFRLHYFCTILYAEDYLYYKNSTSILLMPSKYHEFWVNIFSFSQSYFVCINLQSRLWKSTREKWTGNLTNCFALHYSTKYLQCDVACQRSAEQMISHYWEIAALNPTNFEIIVKDKLQLKKLDRFYI